MLLAGVDASQVPALLAANLKLWGIEGLGPEHLPAGRTVRGWVVALGPLADLVAGLVSSTTYHIDGSTKFGEKVATLIGSSPPVRGVDGKLTSRRVSLGGCFVASGTSEGGLVDIMEFGVFGVERALASAHEYLTESGINAEFIPNHFTEVRVLCPRAASHTALSEPWVNVGGRQELCPGHD
jgi:hypothetical protein